MHPFHPADTLAVFIGGDETVEDVDDAAGMLGDVRLVGDEDDCLAAGADFVKDAHDFVTCFCVEVAGGLIRHEDGGVVDEGAGDGDPLALAAGEFGGKMVDAVPEFDLSDVFFGDFTAFAEVSATIDHREFHIFADGHLRQEIEILKDKADLHIAGVGKLDIIEAVHAATLEDIMPG